METWKSKGEVVKEESNKVPGTNFKTCIITITCNEIKGETNFDVQGRFDTHIIKCLDNVLYEIKRLYKKTMNESKKKGG